MNPQMWDLPGQSNNQIKILQSSGEPIVPEHKQLE